MKGLFKFLPKFITERIKIYYYDLKQPGYKFILKENFYKTQTKFWTVNSYTPLYFITKEIERYEKYYKIKYKDTVIDAGSFNGILSLVYAEKAKDGKIFSFEPDKTNLKRLEENLNLNDYPQNIHLIKKGLWSQSGEINFYADGSVASSSFYRAENAQEQTIKVTSLDDFIEENSIEKVDFIKMDVEGAELDILKGATRLLNTLKPNLSIATYHIVENELTYKSVEDFFNGINYPYKTVFFEDGEIITYAGPQIEN